MTEPWDEIFVLNLRRSKERWADMRAKLGRMGLSAHRLEGVDGSEMSSEVIRQSSTSMCAAFCTPATIGCFLSHRNAWRQVVERGLSSALILEDDAEFGPGFRDVIEHVSRELPDDFDLVLLGCFQYCNPRDSITAFESGWASVLSQGWPDRAVRYSEHLSIPGFTSGLHAYVLSKKGAERLLERFEKASFHVDIALSLDRGDLQVYSANPPVVFQDQRVSVSQIAAKPPYLLNTLFDEIPINEQGTTFAYIMSEPAGRVPLVDYPINGHTIAFWIILAILYHFYPRGLFLLLASSLFDACIELRNGKKPSSFSLLNLFACIACIARRTFLDIRPVYRSS